MQAVTPRDPHVSIVRITTPSVCCWGVGEELHTRLCADGQVGELYLPQQLQRVGLRVVAV